MWRKLSLIPAYFVLGIGLVPMPNMSNVQNVSFNECHRSCHAGPGGKGLVCGPRQCSGNSSISTTKEPVKHAISRGHVPHGSTGPTHPPPPTTGRKQY